MQWLHARSLRALPGAEQGRKDTEDAEQGVAVLRDFWVSSVQLREWQELCNGNLQMLLFAASWLVAGKPSNPIGKHSSLVSLSPFGDQPAPACPSKSPVRQSLLLKKVSLGSFCEHPCEIFALHLREGAR